MERINTCERGVLVANVLTGLRIVCALILMLCPTFSTWFYILYLIAGVSDVFDGIAARRFGKETKFGARFDTAADIVFVVIVLVKTVRAIRIPLWLMIGIVCIAAVKAVNMICGFVRFRRFVSEHTVLNKICGVLLFGIPLCIGRLPQRAITILVILTCMFAAAAAIQEGVYIRIGKEIG